MKNIDNLKQKSKVKMTSKWIDTYGDSALAKFLNTGPSSLQI